MKTFLLTLLTFLSCHFLTAQNCPPATEANGVMLNGNNYRGPILADGSPFWYSGTNESPGLEYDDPISGRIKTIFAQGLWMGGLSPAGDLYLFANRYNSTIGDNRFAPGPVDQNGELLTSNCTDFDRTWSVRRFEVEAHLADYADNQLIDSPIPAVMGWPGRGNTEFFTYSGFDLPITDDEYAPFLDLNANGIYEPGSGEYPVEPKQSSIAEQVVWAVSNTTNALANADFLNPFPVQLQTTAWAFECTDNQQLNDAVFVRYQVDHRGVIGFDSVRFGIWTDFDLGCHQDDYFGVDTLSNTYYVYNMDNDDDVACPGGGTGTGENPPVQSVTWLNQNLASVARIGGVSFGENPPSSSFSEVSFNLLHGRWANGFPLEYGGSGYNQGSYEVDHVFTDNPNDVNGWSLYNTQALTSSQIVPAANVGSFTSGDAFVMDVAYAYHREEGADHLENVNVMLEGVTNLQSLYDGEWTTTCTSTVCEDDCVYPGDLNADGIANYVDLVALHFGVNEAGPERSGINAWAPRPADSWGADQVIGPVDLKHLDGNGDGIVNVLDYSKTEDHYNLTRVGYEVTTDYTEGPELSLEVRNVTNPGGPMEPGELSIACVDITSGVADMRAVVFELEYDPNYFRGSSVSGASGFSELDFNYVNRVKTGRYECTLVRSESNFPQNEVTRTLCFLLVTISDFPPDFPTDPTRIRFSNVRGWLADGTEIEIGGTEAVINIEGVTTTGEPLWAKGISIFPNPASDYLNLELSDAPIEQLEIIDATGRIVLKQESIFTRLDIRSLSSGTYFVRLISEKEAVARKFVKW